MNSQLEIEPEDALRLLLRADEYLVREYGHSNQNAASRELLFWALGNVTLTMIDEVQ